MLDQKRYARPPITEAVIELKFSDNLGPREMERLRDRFKYEFVTVEDRSFIEFSIHAENVSHNASPAGYKMTARNAVDVILINSNSLCTVRLAPYETWENLLAAARSNFVLFTKILGHKQVVRIGVRFLNRFDIPNRLIQGIDITEFLMLGIALPDVVGKSIGPYSLAVNTVHDATGAKLLIQSAIVPPALIDHTSITLDTDAFWDSDIPQRTEDMWEKTATLRIAKNAVFENSITDKLRELFK
jgi:uncharacterized protein (TIGR04255 family)